MLVGTAGCTYLLAFRGGDPPLVSRQVVCPPIGLVVKGAGSKSASGGEPAHDATVRMSPFWNCPTRWHHD